MAGKSAVAASAEQTAGLRKLAVSRDRGEADPYLARAWAKRGADLRVPAPGQAKKVAITAAFDHAARRFRRQREDQAPSAAQRHRPAPI